MTLSDAPAPSLRSHDDRVEAYYRRRFVLLSPENRPTDQVLVVSAETAVEAAEKVVPNLRELQPLWPRDRPVKKANGDWDDASCIIIAGLSYTGFRFYIARAPFGCEGARQREVLGVLPRNHVRWAKAMLDEMPHLNMER